MKRDIENREDIEVLVQLFYSRLLKDPLMAPHFEHTDFVHHTPPASRGDGDGALRRDQAGQGRSDDYGD